MKQTIAGSVALMAWRLLEFYGIDPAECFGNTGVTREFLQDPKSRLPYEVCDQVYSCLHRVIDDPCAGLNVAGFWHPSTFGVLGYAMLSSHSIRESLMRLERYQKAVASESRLTVTETAQGLVLQQHYMRYQTGEFPIVVDSALVTFLHICRFNYGDVLDPVEVNLMREKPEQAGRYYAAFRCPVNFSQPVNNLVLPIEAVDRPIPSANLKLAQMHDRVLQEYLAEQDRGDLITRVRESIIQQLPSGDANKDQVAADLLMSSRTLQRRLSEEGTNFAEVLNDTRKELAQQYIEDDSLPIKEISYLLGFSEAANFTRAYKRWTGMTPTGVRVDS